MKLSLKNRKIGSWVLPLFVGFVILAMLFIVYVSMDRNRRNQAYQTSDLLIEQVKNVIKVNERKQQSLTDSLKENYISKAKGVAYIIDIAPETEFDIDELKYIAKLMSIDEIHLFTTDGEIYFGTVPKYYGYSFDSGEQMAYFKPMLTDKNLAMCQDITPNTAEEKPMMYAICWNEPGTRIVQIGLEPRRLIREMQSNAISEVVASIPAYEGIDILVSNEKTGKILGATATRHIGKSMADIGLGKVNISDTEHAHFRTRVDNRDSYCSIQRKDEYLIAVIDDRATVNKELPYTILLIFVYLMIAVITLSIVVKKMADRRERLIAISERALAASEAKTSFLSNMSHEIRTPINAILGMNEMIKRESDDSDVLAYSQNIKNAGNTLLGIINDILDFSKIEEGRLEIIDVDYDLSILLDDLVNMIKTRLDEKGLALNLDFDRHTPKLLHGDEKRIKQIITNILTNAAKYTEKGSVTFRVTYETLDTDENELILKVSIKDTGIGIKPEDLEKLFSRFERIEEKRNRNIEGTGLGMNITKGLLEMMGSALEVKSIYGEGSEFGFSLHQKVVKWEPLGFYEEAWEKSRRQVEVYKQKLTAPDAQVLVVDDNKLNLMVFSSLLKQTRIKIDTALSGDEGIELARSKHYDIIFLDHMMPEKDGIEVLHELKENISNPNVDTPYICLTANAISGARVEYISAGFEDYLTKPINPVELEELLLKFLPENKLISEGDAAVYEGSLGDNGAAGDDSDNMVSVDEIPDKLRALEAVGVDVEAGISNTGGLEDYIPVLEVFHEVFDEKKRELEELYYINDFENYTIKVHALKSSARILGATDLGEKAQKLESAVKQGDFDYIKDHHGEFMEDYLRLRGPLEEIFAKSDEEDLKKPEAGTTIIEEFYKELKAAATDMDYDRIEEAFREMEDYAMPANAEDLFKNLHEAALQFDYERIIKLLP